MNPHQQQQFNSNSIGIMGSPRNNNTNNNNNRTLLSTQLPSTSQQQQQQPASFQSIYLQRTASSMQHQQQHSSMPSPNNILYHPQQQQHFSATLNNQGFPEGANPTMIGSQSIKPGNPVTSLELSNANRVVDLSIQQLLQLSPSNNNNNNNNTSTLPVASSSSGASTSATINNNNLNTNSSTLLMQQQHQHASSLFQSMFNNNTVSTNNNSGASNSNNHLQMVNGNHTSSPVASLSFNNNNNNTAATTITSTNSVTFHNNANNDTEAMLRLLLNNPSLLEGASPFDMQHVVVGNNINPNMQQHQTNTNFEANIMTENDLNHMGKDSNASSSMNMAAANGNGMQQGFNQSEHFSFSDIFDIPHTMRSSSPISSHSSSESSSTCSSNEKLEANAADEPSEKKKGRRRSDSGGGNQEETTTKRKRRIKDRLMWSDELHQHFVQVVESLGVYDARPKEIKKIMNVDFLTTTHIKSHLQKYRTHLKKKAQQEGVHLPSLKRSLGSSSSLTKSKRKPKKKKNDDKEENPTTTTTSTANIPSVTAATTTTSNITASNQVSASSIPNTSNVSLPPPSTCSSALPLSITTNGVVNTATNGNPMNNQNRTNSPPGSSQLFDPSYLSRLLANLDKPLGTNNNTQKVSPVANNYQNLTPPSPKSATTVPLFVQQQRRNSEYSTNSNSISNHSQLQVNNAMNINFGNIQSAMLQTNNGNNFQRVNENNNQLGFVNNNFVTIMDNNQNVQQQSQQQNNGSTMRSNPALVEYLTILRNICSTEKDFADLFQNIQSQIREARDMDLVVEGFRLGFLCGHRIKQNNNSK